MDIQKRSTRFGAALILFAVLLRVAALVLAPEAVAFHLPTRKAWQAQTNLVRDSATLQQANGSIWQDPLQTAPSLPEYPRFTPADLAHAWVQYASDCPYQPDLESLLLQQLSWDLTGEEPKVLILHTHASESYTKLPGQSYKETASYRTLEEAYNMVAVGDYLAKLLEDAGISVLHDRQIHDYPSYNDSYVHARDSIRAYLDAYPSICLVLDLHRDSALNADGSQYVTSATVDGQNAAQIMLVVGTNASGNYHPHWQDNLAVALKLQVLLEKQAPGITRQSILRAQRFNQDLAQAALLVEVGTAGNTLEEAMRSVPVLAQALVLLMHGTQTEQ